MKRNLFSFGMFMCVVLSNIIPSRAQWYAVGNPGFSDGATSFNSLAIDNVNTPYVAYVDLANSDKITVMKYNNATWVNVGTKAFSAGHVKDVNIAMDGNNMPYVAYADMAYGRRLVVQRFDGSNWVPVGTPGFSAGRADDVAFVIDASNTPYVAFSDNGNDGKLAVMKYDGSNWVHVGYPGITPGQAIGIDMAVAKDGTAYVIYKDIANGGVAHVTKYSGGSWVAAGNAGLGFNINANQYTIAIDSKGTPYVSYATNRAGDESLLVFNGYSWTVAASGFATGAVQQPTLTAANDGKVYMTFTDAGRNGEATVVSYDGTAVQTSGIAGSTGDYPALAVAADGALYVSYRAQAEGMNDMPAVLKYQTNSITGIAHNNSLNLYPNPATKLLTIEGKGKIAALTVIDMTGKTMHVPVALHGQTATADVSGLAPGNYILNGMDENGSVSVNHFQKL